MHINSKLLFERYAVQLFDQGAKVLEVGPDSFPSTYQSLAEARLGSSIEWHTLDMYDSPDLTYSNSREYSFDIPDETYDVVLSGQVIEHVEKPWRWVPELARVTKTGGLVITINPVSWGFHESPIDCWRIYPDGMRALYEESSIDVLSSRWESLETPQFRRFIPGLSMDCQPPKKRIAYQILGRLGFPVERAYDTITVGRKKGSTDPRQLNGAAAEPPSGEGSL